MKTTVEN